MAETTTFTRTLQCIVVTPEMTVLDTDAQFVAIPLSDGECGIAPGRSPLIGRLGYGEMRIRTSGGERRFYLDGGFVQVADNVVSVLTNRAVPADKLDAVIIQDQLQTALARKAAGPEELAIRDRLILQARGQLRVANRV